MFNGDRMILQEITVVRYEYTMLPLSKGNLLVVA